MARRTERATGSGPSQRQLRVGELIRKELSDAFVKGEVMDPEIEGLTITVPEVRMSPDLRLATVYVMPLGGARREGVVRALARHARFLRGYLSPRLDLRFMPELRFRLDETFDEAARVDAILRSPEVARDLRHEEAEGDDEG
jgi:ribosome-binding factor A